MNTPEGRPESLLEPTEESTPSRGRGRLNCLEGYVVVDLSQYLAGPFATEILSALGATVIKVEPPSGDYFRKNRPMWATAHGVSLDPPHDEDELISLRFLKRNEGKYSITLNMKRKESKAILERIVKNADAFIHNYKPSTARALGVTLSEISAMNDRIVYCAIDGLGSYGEADDNRPIVDGLVHAMAGAMYVTDGDDDDPPQYLDLPLADLITGIYAALAVLAGLIGRDGKRGGAEENGFSVSMLGALSALLWGCKPIDLIPKLGLPERGVNPESPIEPVIGFLQSADDRWIYINAVSQDQWQRILAATEIPELREPRYEDRKVRYRDKAAIEATIANWARALPYATVMERFVSHKVGAWPVRTAADIMADDQFRESFLYEVSHPIHGPSGAYNAVFPVVPAGNKSTLEDFPAPLVGEHTDYVLRAFGGFSDQEIDALRQSGVVAREGA